MSYTEFCCRSGGSNLNAGTRTGDGTEPGTTAAMTYASGSWVAGTGVFTVASGDPVADGVAVGDFASVYADGSTQTGFVGRVTARTTTTITVSLSAKAGTAPTDGTGNRTLRIGGAWQGPNASSGFPLNFVQSTLTNASGDLPRVNLKNSATYSVTASIAPTTAQNAVTIQGYSSTYGDLGKATIDGGTSGASYNLFAPVANSLLCADLIFCNNGATGTGHGIASSANVVFVRCAVHSVRGIGFFSPQNCIECEAYNCNLSAAANWGGFYNVATCVNCISHDNSASNTHGFAFCTNHVNCIADSNSAAGFHTNATINLVGCDAYNNGSHGLNVIGGFVAIARNSNFVKNGGWGVLASSTQVVNVRGCGFGAGTQANASGNISAANGVEVASVYYADDVTPWADPDNGDFRIALDAATAAGIGDFLQTQSGYGGTIGYPDIGAAQRLVTGGGGGYYNPFRNPVFG